MLGAAWYPEQWPESRWEADLALMEKAHLHVVRVGEFAWSSLEPTEGHYDLDWLERAINLAGKHGIYTVLGTPTATPPAWLTTEVSGDAAHRRERPARRARQPAAVQLVEREVPRACRGTSWSGWRRALGTIRMSSAGRSTTRSRRPRPSDGSAEAVSGLAAEALRHARQSERALDDDLLEPDLHRLVADSDSEARWHRQRQPGAAAELAAVLSDTWRSYLLNQIDVIRPRADARQFITTNTMGFFQCYDHYITESVLDLAAWDDYIPDGKIDPVRNGMAHDLTRGFKRKNFWVMETQPGFVNWSSVNISLDKGEVRAMAWHDIAHGADAVSYWQWRSALNGQEQYHGTLVGADGTPVPLYPEVQQIGAEFEKAGPVLARNAMSSPRWRCCTRTRAAGRSSGSRRRTSSIRWRRWRATMGRCGTLTHAVDIVSPQRRSCRGTSWWLLRR